MVDLMRLRMIFLTHSVPTCGIKYVIGMENNNKSKITLYLGLMKQS